MNKILNLEGLTITHDQILNKIGILRCIEKIDLATCICRASATSKLYQNNELTIRDLPWADKVV